jgi:hypothetical protein
MDFSSGDCLLLTNEVVPEAQFAACFSIAGRTTRRPETPPSKGIGHAEMANA